MTSFFVNILTVTQGTLDDSGGAYVVNSGTLIGVGGIYEGALVDDSFSAVDAISFFIRIR